MISGWAPESRPGQYRSWGVLGERTVIARTWVRWCRSRSGRGPAQHQRAGGGVERVRQTGVADGRQAAVDVAFGDGGALGNGVPAVLPLGGGAVVHEAGGGC
ncbi:hypothetical protein GCM10020000_86940 [Streptomyces olivoverticillatus]